MLETGIDIVEIARIANSIQNDRFVNRIFGASELKELRERNMPASTAAACFAAKEAFSKALGTGLRGFRMNEVQLVHNELGKPFLKLSGKAKEIVDGKGLTLSVSITHTDELAAAFVIAYDLSGNETTL